MGFEDIFAYIGEFGPYQRRIYFLLSLTSISCALHKLGGVFLQAKLAHRCLLPFESENVTYQSHPMEQFNMTYPWDSRLQAWSSCRRLASNFSEEYFFNNTPSNHSISCDNGWVYDTTVYQSSTVMEWDLVCDRTWIRATADSMFMLGDVIGSVSFGFLSDKYGRRPMFFVAVILQLTFGLLVAISPTEFCFVLFRLLLGSTASGLFLVAYVIALEMVGPRKRALAGVACQLFFTFGYALAAFFAYFINNWRWLQVAFTLPATVFLTYFWILPESSRWLLSNGRIEEAKAIVLKVAKVNQVNIPSSVLDGILRKDGDEKDTTQEQTKKGSIFELIKYPSLRYRALNIFFNWFVNNCAYYGLSWNTSNLGGNDYVNFLISGAVEVPAYTFLILTLNRWGRKHILCGTMLLGGAALLLILFVPDGLQWPVTTLAMIGKLAVTASYGTIYIFTAEQFPTVIRNVALGASSTCARAGGFTAPYINLLADYWKSLPLLVFGGMILTGGLMGLLLPETLNRKLPDTFEDGEAFGRSKPEDKFEGSLEDKAGEINKL